ncbi:hypothetical protein Syun_023278 [Stephania yunnanensis]|uniref:Uncharacterized protein n=1 Tax=Stephania yunnanensis TaxID=152371 RepID=A0AAP0FHL6_9MAGN
MSTRAGLGQRWKGSRLRGGGGRSRLQKGIRRWRRQRRIGRWGKGRVGAEVDEGPSFGLGAGEDGEGVAGVDQVGAHEPTHTPVSIYPTRVVAGVMGSVAAPAVAMDMVRLRRESVVVSEEEVRWRRVLVRVVIGITFVILLCLGLIRGVMGVFGCLERECYFDNVSSPSIGTNK